MTVFFVSPCISVVLYQFYISSKQFFVFFVFVFYLKREDVNKSKLATAVTHVLVRIVQKLVFNVKKWWKVFKKFIFYFWPKLCNVTFAKINGRIFSEKAKPSP